MRAGLFTVVQTDDLHGYYLITKLEPWPSGVLKLKEKTMLTTQPNQNCIFITSRWDTGILWAMKQPCRGYRHLLAAGPCLWYWDFIL